MNVTKKLVDTFTWAASSDVEVDLPTEGLITRIDLELALTADGSIADNIATLGLWRAIEAFKIQGGGGRNYFNLTGKQMGMLWHYINLIDFPATTWRNYHLTSQYLALRCHFGSRQRDIYGRDNPYDLTVAIPAMDETNLKMIWTTGASADTIDEGVSIDSATMRATVYEVLHGENAWSKMVPEASCYTYNPVATKSALSGKIDVPTGGFVRRIGINAQDSTSLTGQGRLNVADQVTEIAIQLPKLNLEPVYVRTRTLTSMGPRFEGMQAVNVNNTFLPYATPGFYMIDLRPYDNRDYGLDCRNLRGGDVKLAMTIDTYSSNDREYIWFDQVRLYGGVR